MLRQCVSMQNATFMVYHNRLMEKEKKNVWGFLKLDLIQEALILSRAKRKGKKKHNSTHDGYKFIAY